MLPHRLPVALIRILAILTLLVASVVPVAAASSSSPTVSIGSSVDGMTATITVNINRGTQQIASCVYVLDDAAAASCGAAATVGIKASRYVFDLTDQSLGEHVVTVTIVLTDRGTAADAATFTIVAGEVDTDGDGVPDATDNCPTVANPKQTDSYGSAAGDACEDTDGNGIPDVNEANMCVSIDGAPFLGPVGTATCDSTKSLTSSRNIAIADGDGADAIASDGNGNTATAIGDNSRASADQGDGNTATATGDSAGARADNGDHNTAIATGDNSSAQASLGDDNTATATGDAAAAVALGNGNNATASGDNAFASADSPTGCTVTNGTCPSP